MPKLTYLAVGAAFWAVLTYLLASSLPPVAWVLLALAAGGASVHFARLMDDVDGSRSPAYVPLVLAGVAQGGAVLLMAVAGTANLVHLLGTAAAVAAAWLLAAMTAQRQQAPCFICKNAAGDQRFHCPRCHQVICARPTCWIARHARCRWCDEREVVAFPTTEPWWSARVGARAAHGECAICFKDANERDLRECRQCHWPMCRRCWDLQNGRCSHCDWVMPDLPPELAAYVMAGAPGRAAAPSRPLPAPAASPGSHGPPGRRA